MRIVWAGALNLKKYSNRLNGYDLIVITIDISTWNIDRNKHRWIKFMNFDYNIVEVNCYKALLSLYQDKMLINDCSGSFNRKSCNNNWPVVLQHISLILSYPLLLL